MQAKKTRRDEDWPMHRRLVEAHYFKHQGERSIERLEFWFQELRTPEWLIERCAKDPALCGRLQPKRRLLAFAREREAEALQRALIDEAATERAR